MATTASFSIDRFKSQAKRLKERLAQSGIEIPHSASLEAVAAIHGFKDWNVASAVAKTELKLYMVCCSFAFDPAINKNGKAGMERMGEFQYLVRAKSHLDVEKICAEEFPQFSHLFEKGTEVEIQAILEINDVPEQGVLAHWALLEGGLQDGNLSSGRLGHSLPLKTPGVEFFLWSKAEEQEAKNQYEPFIRY